MQTQEKDLSFAFDHACITAPSLHNGMNQGQAILIQASRQHTMGACIFTSPRDSAYLKPFFNL